jgi:hypothetical protein
MPRRIQLTNWFMPSPPNSRRVTRPSKFGNPFPVRDKTPTGHAAVVAQYRQYLRDNPALVEIIKRELRGFDLICSCRLDWPCHADVLLEVANGMQPL